jgi:uncharacterized protein YeaO (DUF488 family)
MIRIVRLGTPKVRSEGLRLGTVRRPPRGMRVEDRKRYNMFDLWLPELAPSATLIAWAREVPSPATRWKTFAARYTREMAQPPAARIIELLAMLSHDLNFSVGCYCGDTTYCHRRLLATILREAGAKVEAAPLLQDID